MSLRYETKTTKINIKIWRMYSTRTKILITRNSKNKKASFCYKKTERLWRWARHRCPKSQLESRIRLVYSLISKYLIRATSLASQCSNASFVLIINTAFCSYNYRAQLMDNILLLILRITNVYTKWINDAPLVYRVFVIFFSCIAILFL